MTSLHLGKENSAPQKVSSVSKLKNMFDDSAADSSPLSLLGSPLSPNLSHLTPKTRKKTINHLKTSNHEIEDLTAEARELVKNITVEASQRVEASVQSLNIKYQQKQQMLVQWQIDYERQFKEVRENLKEKIEEQEQNIEISNGVKLLQRFLEEKVNMDENSDRLEQQIELLKQSLTEMSKDAEKQIEEQKKENDSAIESTRKTLFDALEMLKRLKQKTWKHC
ncbi:hypothetical protein TrVE_jg4509 [Triparma verrucosa]|uniref:Uncharacterized protein n=1 Tax=Triparma verrucosa TaxID=1606542 RepID=A0A9W7FFM7_9STRA|nr:hypothetical protein TrVE_jg4509 [Triparma verrucosa]